MIKQVGKYYSLEIFAFRTTKGIFRISGSNADDTDDWKEVGTSNFHRWKRKSIYEWYQSGKIEPIKEANTVEKAVLIDSNRLKH